MRLASVLYMILELSLYSLISYYSVSQFYTQPNNPVFYDNGITAYLVIYRSLCSVSGSFANNLLTKLNNYITRSS